MLPVSAETDGMVSVFDVDGETMKIIEENLLADIEKYGLFDYEKDFAHLVPKEMFDAFNVKYFKIAIAKGYLTEERVLQLINSYAEYLIQ